MRLVNLRDIKTKAASRAGNHHKAESNRALRHGIIKYRTEVFKSFIVSDYRFSDLWDASKVNKCNPGFGTRRKKTYTRDLRKRCTVSGRYKGQNQFINLSRFVIRSMVEKGVLPGIYGTGW